MYQEDFERASISRVSVHKERINDKTAQPEKVSSLQKVWHISDRLTRNFLCAALVVICVYAVQSAQFPDGTTITTAVQSIVDEDWDKNLGRIQFVGNMFPETLSVFWNDTGKPDLYAPQSSRILHAWSQDEPYLSFSVKNSAVTALANGTVQSIARDENGNYIVSIAHENNFETVYYELSNCQFREGDTIQASETLGISANNEMMIFELRQEGLPLDPTHLLNLTGGAF